MAIIYSIEVNSVKNQHFTKLQYIPTKQEVFCFDDNYLSSAFPSWDQIKSLKVQIIYNSVQLGCGDPVHSPCSVCSPSGFVVGKV